MVTVVPTGTTIRIPTAPKATTTTTEITAMRTDAVLTLTQWLSPAFPVGAFTYSHGLEAAFEAGWIKTWKRGSPTC